jgi:hypothetical protein
MSLSARASEGTAAPRANNPYSGYLHVLTRVDAVTFTVKRSYPAKTAWAHGAAPYQALLRIVVKRPSVSNGLARVVASAELCEPPAREGAVTARAAKAAKPLLVIEDTLFFYDPADGRFYESGPTATTVDTILDTVYEKHWRTVRWDVRLWASIATGSRAVTDLLIHGGQEVVVRLVRALSAGGSVLGAPRV